MIAITTSSSINEKPLTREGYRLNKSLVIEFHLYSISHYYANLNSGQRFEIEWRQHEGIPKENVYLLISIGLSIR